MHVKQMVTRSAASVDRCQISPILLNNFLRWYCKADDKDEKIENESEPDLFADQSENQITEIRLM